MGKLFEQVEGNHFKLSEGSNSDFCISKLEEEQALQIILRVCVPEAVKAFNEDVCKRRKSYKKVTEQEVRKNLKKVRHDRNCEGPFPHTDYIRYSSQIGKYKPFTFLTYKPTHNIVNKKYDKPTLMTSWTYPYSCGSFDVPVFKNDIVMSKSSINEEQEDDQSISKMEEQQAYVYMIRHILPKALEDTYYKHIKKVPSLYPERKYPRITLQDLSKNVRKIRVGHDRIEYESVINDRVSFDIIIVKEGSQMICGVQGPFDNILDYRWYDIDQGFGKLQETDFYKYNELELSKIEEQEAFQAIKRILVPKFVKSWNDNVKFSWQHRKPIDIKDVLHKLKKIFRDWNSVHYSYDASTLKMNRIIYFYVDKCLRHEGEEIEQPGIRLGYYDAQGGGVVYHYLEDLCGKSPNDVEKEKLQEEYCKPNMSINKIEELESLDFLKKKVVQKMVELFNYYADHPTVIEYKPEKVVRKHISAIEITRGLKKTFHERKGQSEDSKYSDYIEYTSVVYGIPLTFYIEKQAELVRMGNDRAYNDIIVVGLHKPYHNPEFSKQRLGYNFDIESNKVSDIMTEGPDEPDYTAKWAEHEKKQTELGRIDKFEEHNALDFLKKVVVPKLVQHYNHRSNDKPSMFNHYNPPKPVTIADVNRNLKKSNHWKYGEEGNPHRASSDYIQYTSKVGDRIFSFYIDKMHDQTQRRSPRYNEYMVLGAGYDDPFALQSICFQVGENYL